jgi:hypothetical protein
MNKLLEVGKIAAGAVTANACVVLDNNGKVALPGAANAARFGGVAQTAAATGAQVTVAQSGIVDVVAAAAFNPGEELEIADTSGNVQKAATTAATVRNIVGIAQEAASQAGDIVEMLIAPSTHTNPAA